MISLHGLAPPRSVYLHIPFCYRRCFYCDFAVVPLGDKADGATGSGSESVKSYLKLLHREISLSDPVAPLSTIYIGGGTPSILSPCQISELLKHLDDSFGIQSGAELTMEMDPASFDEDYLAAVLDIGINRVSLGGQSFDDEVLAQLGRNHSQRNLLEACDWLHSAQKDGSLCSWSLDIIQNLPGQELITWKHQLDQSISTMAPHLSIYDLSIEPGTVFAWRQKRGELSLPDEGLSVEIMNLTNEVLKTAGFSRYEISNYAFPGHASRHNRVYWSGSGWWGFGQGATSAPWGQRLARPRTRDGYKRWIEIQEEEGLDHSLLAAEALPMQLDDKLLVGLRCREGIDFEALARGYGWDDEKCQKYLSALELRWRQSIQKGWLKRVGRRYRLTDPEGISISNQVLVEVLLWWDSLPNDAVSLANS